MIQDNKKTRGTAGIGEGYTPVMERTRKCVPTCISIEKKIKIIENALERAPRYKQISEVVKIENPRCLGYLMKYLQIEDECRFIQMVNSDETITIVSNEGLKVHGGFGWVAVRENEISMTCHGHVNGSLDQGLRSDPRTPGCFLQQMSCKGSVNS